MSSQCKSCTKSKEHLYCYAGCSCYAYTCTIKDNQEDWECNSQNNCEDYVKDTSHYWGIPLLIALVVGVFFLVENVPFLRGE